MRGTTTCETLPRTRSGAAGVWSWTASSLLLAVLIVGGENASVAVADEADDTYNLAVGLYKRTRWDLAAESFDQFLKKYPKHDKAPAARLYLGLSQVNLKDYQGARDTLRQFIKEAPQNRNLAHAMYRVGECSYLLDDLKSAGPELKAFIDKFPEDQLLERALPYLGDVQLRLKEFDAAARSFQKALMLFPDGVMAEDSRFGLARSYEALKKFPEAIQLYQKLVENPAGARAAEAQLNLAARYFDDKNYAASAAAYARLEQQFPESPLLPVARLNRGFALYQAGDFRQAITQFDAAAAEKKQTLEATYWKGLSLKSLTDYPQAITAFHTAYDANRDHPLAESVLYHWADSEQRQGHLEEARGLFQEVVKRWPQGELADDALHYAAVTAFDAGKKPETEALLNQFARDYPRSGLRWHQEVLRGRLELLKGNPAQAATHFDKALQGSEAGTTKSWARYYLGYTWHQMGKESEALAATEPLATAVDQEPKASPFTSVLLLRGAAQLALGKQAKTTEQKKPLFAAAVDSINKFLAKTANGEQRAQALAVQALAAAHGGLKDIAKRDLEALQKDFPQTTDLDKTTYEVAEVAYANEDWDWSGELFGKVAAKGKTSAFYARALSGLGWTQSKRKQFAESANSFAQANAAFDLISGESPEKTAKEAARESAAEAGFMQGKSLQDAKKLPEAVAVYQAILKKYAPAPSKNAYLAGLQAARLQGELNQIEQADAAYAELLKLYPQPAELDKVLDEWALLNYAAERYSRSDEIFRRLIQETPQSDLADNAQLSLAESRLLAGKLDEAAQLFQALQANPKSDAQVQQAALHQLINITLERKQWKELRDYCRQLSERFPNGKYRVYAEYHWAEADLNLLDPQAAHDRLVKVLAEKDSPAAKGATWFPPVWVLMAEAQFRLKKYSAVAATMAEFRKWSPKSDLLYVAEEILGRSYKAQAMFPEARAAFERVINDPAGRRTETAAKSQFLIAETYLLEKNYKLAEQEYLKVEILYKFPEWQAPALFQAATCQEQTKRWAEAVKSYESLIKQFPENQHAVMAKERLTAARKRVAA